MHSDSAVIYDISHLLFPEHYPIKRTGKVADIYRCCKFEHLELHGFALEMGGTYTPVEKQIGLNRLFGMMVFPVENSRLLLRLPYVIWNNDRPYLNDDVEMRSDDTISEELLLQSLEQLAYTMLAESKHKTAYEENKESLYDRFLARNWLNK